MRTVSSALLDPLMAKVIVVPVSLDLRASNMVPVSLGVPTKTEVILIPVTYRRAAAKDSGLVLVEPCKLFCNRRSTARTSLADLY